MPHRRRRFVVLLKSGLNILEVGLAKPSAAPGGVALESRIQTGFPVFI